MAVERDRVWATPVVSRGPALVIGVDPGAKGAMVAVSTIHDQARVYRLTSELVGDLRAPRLPAELDNLKVTPVVYMEHVHGRSGWGARETFAFGGYVIGLLALMRARGWPVELVRPQVWQRRGLEAIWHAGGTVPEDPKARSLLAYQHLHPEDPLPRSRYGNHDHNVVDAFHIANYGLWLLGIDRRRWTFPVAVPKRRRPKAGDPACASESES